MSAIKKLEWFSCLSRRWIDALNEVSILNDNNMWQTIQGWLHQHFRGTWCGIYSEDHSIGPAYRTNVKSALLCSNKIIGRWNWATTTNFNRNQLFHLWLRTWILCAAIPNDVRCCCCIFYTCILAMAFSPAMGRFLKIGSHSIGRHHLAIPLASFTPYWVLSVCFIVSLQQFALHLVVLSWWPLCLTAWLPISEGSTKKSASNH